jgi:hypothetical protein
MDVSISLSMQHVELCRTSGSNGEKQAENADFERNGCFGNL